ncbi:MAG: winged helix-turn-helix transcriptional regulator, partial [Duganella sp.]
MHSLDKYDCAILTALQIDGTLSMAALSEKVGLSSTPCWKRVKRLEEEGYIESR